VRIRILEERLAERDADAEVGRAIRELTPHKNDYELTLIITVNDRGLRKCAINTRQYSPGLCFSDRAEFATVQEAIADYNTSQE